ncbi:PAS domain S-box-containing protein/diguanylate cyclase (GGDEF) domain-containing protein [Mariprofundus ferrinatatus]|uniref:PAS domain S-box-containing protein/diguanylate cyclase (GGDEF) domain-containing protein n=1 Tax=Mariprofundus ferrinatatus TaxID=1921087 RepID=A0A2K8L1X7_9PROT|nr:EAL domain-containing protein [Mariprofundus ferrinatatus]ATX81092.1 PAS domain S-box-containing protein/diguanylate cyclase (GGDEF) domain-containing protein [Mariprofundus ferrinatatus]
MASADRVNLRGRVMFVVLGILLVGATLLFFKIQNDQRQSLRASYAAAMEDAVSSRSAHLQVYVNELRKQTRFLAQTPPVQALVRATGGAIADRDGGDTIAAWKQRLQEIFKAFLTANPGYYQLRYIGVADHGRELVRVERQQEGLVVAADAQLQAKGDRDYFRESLKLSEGSVYISNITLNREHGQVQQPHVQTVRASAPVFAGDGKLFGMVVANLDIGPGLAEIMKPVRPGVQGYLANQDGDFLFHPDPGKAFGFDLGQRYRWQQEMPGLLLHNPEQQLREFSRLGEYPKGIETQSLTIAGEKVHLAAGKIHYDLSQPERYLALIYSLPDALIDEQMATLRNMLSLGFLGILLLLGLIMTVMLRRMFAPLEKLTDGAMAIADGSREVELPEKASGEIGTLVHAFDQMLNGIKQQERKLGSLHDHLRQSEAYANHVIETVPQGIIVIDADGRMIRVNNVAADLFGYSIQEMLGLPVEALMPAELVDIHRDGRVEYQQGEPKQRRRMGEGDNHVARRKDGEEFFVEVELCPLHMNDDHHVIATVSDVTQRKLAERELQIAATVFNAHEAMFITDPAANILRVNDAFLQVTGYSREEVIGKNPRILQSGRHTDEFYQEMWRHLNEYGVWQGEIWDRRKNGEIFPKWATISSVTDERGRLVNYVSMFSDITAVKEAQEEVLRLAYYDPLTGLPNRRRLVEQLQHNLKESARSRHYGGLLFIDLDNFKIINDTLGHDQGDALLKEVAHRLQAVLREVDTVARLGGDEFVIILHELGSDKEQAVEGARHVGEKLVATLAAPYRLQGRNFSCTGSVGATLFQGMDVSVEEIFRNSDIAMYEAKKLGRNGLRFFDPAMQASLEKRSQLESDLRDALEQEQFVLHYQKQVDDKGRTIGAEALIRWKHPVRGMIPPFEFIPVCEESGLIVPVGQWLMKEACQKLNQWQQNERMKDYTLSVNISMKEFMEEGFVRQVHQTIEESGVNPSNLELEITESIGHANPEELIEKLHLLRLADLSLAMDDFGTGYSSLSYLKKLPLDVLKIDQSFVRDLGVDTSDESIVQAIIKVGETLGLEVIAEGVESEEQFELLKQYGCRKFQGYYFARPLPAEEFEQSCVPCPEEADLDVAGV